MLRAKLDQVLSVFAAQQSAYTFDIAFAGRFHPLGMNENVVGEHLDSHRYARRKTRNTFFAMSS
ncbi:MAG TPA: hypothetical protein VGC62_12720 [Pseudomonas sp.]|uniref:hypothetical protein n=1 Tax=Pseudomonas sp. TaxID=306 RepID=UPI002EDA7D17